MAYSHYSYTSSGWEIGEDPKADPDKRWRAVHPRYGERFFDAHDKILPYTCEHMVRQFTKLMKREGKP